MGTPANITPRDLMDWLFAEEAEKSLLGAYMVDPGELAHASTDEADFYDRKNAHVWNAMTAIHDRGDPVTAVSLEAELERRGMLGAIGGLDRLLELAHFVGTAANVEYYAKEIRTKRVTREVLDVYGTAQQLVRKGIEGDELLGEVQEAVSGISIPGQNQVTNLGDGILREFRRLLEVSEARTRGEPLFYGLPTGITALDEKIGGIPLGVVTTLSARTSVGKSTLALAIARNLARQGIASGFCSYEDPEGVYTQRALAAECNLPVTRFRTGDFVLGDMVGLSGKIEAAKQFLKHVHFLPAHGLSVSRAIRLALTGGRETGNRPKLIIVDYIQNATRSSRWQKKHEAIGEAMIDMQNLAAKEDIAIVVISQIRRLGHKGPPTLEDMKDAGSIEECSKLVIALHPVHDDQLEIHVLKNSAGPKDVIEVQFDGPRARFKQQEQS